MSTDRTFPAAEPVDMARASAARVYDWYLGGSANWAVDREFGERAVATFPRIKQLAVANRRWLGRVVRATLDAGITQFLDLGSGIPCMGAVHEWVAAHPRTEGGRGRVVYVDNEPVASAYVDLYLDKTEQLRPWVTSIQGDLRDAESIFADPEVKELFDLTEPVCVLMVAVLHFVGDATGDEGGGEGVVPHLLSDYRRRAAPGSWLAVSHIATDAVTDPTELAQVEAFVASYQDTQNALCLRDRTEIASWFHSWGEVLEPGVTHLPDWRPGRTDGGPDLDAVRPFAWCGVAATSRFDTRQLRRRPGSRNPPWHEPLCGPSPPPGASLKCCWSQPKEKQVTVRTEWPEATPAAVTGAESEFDLDITLIEMVDPAHLINMTDDGCGQTCEKSTCISAA